jgi:DNA-binding response OmpR family regulator
MPEHRPTILIADDDPLMLSMIIDVLAPDGYRLLVARDGREAIQLASMHEPDLMLIDVVMPDIDGYAVFRALQEKNPGRELPIIFLSALDETAEIGQAFDVGALDYITKPFSPGNLRTRLRTWLLRRSSGTDAAGADSSEASSDGSPLEDHGTA